MPILIRSSSSKVHFLKSNNPKLFQMPARILEFWRVLFISKK